MMRAPIIASLVIAIALCFAIAASGWYASQYRTMQACMMEHSQATCIEIMR